MTELVISSEPDASPQDTALISDGLDSFNLQASGHSTYSPVVLLARDPEGGVRGGLLGHVWGGWLHVRYLWVAEAWRGQGFGRALLVRAEEEARQAGARRVYLSTFSFQAPEFYKRLGYAVYAAVEDFPEGHTRYHLRKDLAARDYAGLA